MKCPLLKIARAGLEFEAARPLDECLKKECAWYDSIIQTCLIYSLHTDLAHLCSILKDIKDKMPHAGQFTK